MGTWLTWIVSRPIVLVGALAVLSNVVWFALWSDARLNASRAESALSDDRRAYAEQRAEFERQVALIQQERAHAVSLLQSQHAENIRRINEDHERLVADLRAGNVRMRAHWQGCVHTGELSAAAAAAARADDSAGLRAESAGRIVRAADECDAKVVGLQNYVRAVTDAVP